MVQSRSAQSGVSTTGPGSDRECRVVSTAVERRPPLTSWLDLPKPWLILAPMAGVCDWPFREVCYRFGAEVTFSHLLSAQGLVASPKRLLPAVGARHGDRPFVAQLFGSTPADFRAAARILTDALPLAGIDVNMGCPAELVVKHHHGAWLLREPDLAAEIVAATVAGTHLPVTAKVRLGWESLTVDALAPKLVQAGARALIVHGRTREQQYHGLVSAEGIAEVRRAVDVPVVANGDVRSVADARRMLDVTGADGLMVGRGAVGNPWLFASLQAELKGERGYLGTELGVADLMRWHVRLAFEDQPGLAHLTVRKHLISYSRGHPGSAALRRATAGLRCRADFDAWIAGYESSRAAA